MNPYQQLLAKLISLDQQLLAIIQNSPKGQILAPTAITNPNPTPIMIPTNQALYNAGKAALGTHLTLDNNVPGDLGCMESVSKLYKIIGVEGIPAEGYEGTAQGLTFLENSDQFEEKVGDPILGDTVIFATGTSTIGSPHGHILIMGNNSLMSNDSDTGLFMAKYTLRSAIQYFSTTLGFPMRIFALKGI